MINIINFLSNLAMPLIILVIVFYGVKMVRDAKDILYEDVLVDDNERHKTK